MVSEAMSKGMSILNQWKKVPYTGKNKPAKPYLIILGNIITA
jgi:hypothetical protein